MMDDYIVPNCASLMEPGRETEGTSPALLNSFCYSLCIGCLQEAVCAAMSSGVCAAMEQQYLQIRHLDTFLLQRDSNCS